MAGTRLIALALIVVGALALAYRGFSYTKEETAAKIGSIELKVEQKKTVTIPVWAGIGAIVIGGLILFAVPRK